MNDASMDFDYILYDVICLMHVYVCPSISYVYGLTNSSV